MRVIYTIIIVFIILFVITFSLQNTVIVPLNYYDVINVEFPAYMLMFIAFLIGVVFTSLMGFAERLSLTRTIRELNKTVRDLRRELRASETSLPKDEEAEILPE